MTVSGAGATGPRRILVTDDDAKVLAALSHILRDAGHIVFGAYNGFSAYLVAANSPTLDLLITNTRLSNIEAPDLIRRVRAVRPGLAILHIGEPLPSDPALDGVHTLPEPFNRDQLLAAVSRVM